MLTFEEALQVLDRLKGWNSAQRSVSAAFGGATTEEDKILDSKRLALKNAWDAINAHASKESPNA